MSIWDTAGAAIDAAFVDPEMIVYTGAGLTAQPLSAIRSDGAAPAFAGEGATLRTITYEVQQSDFPTKEPSEGNSFGHRGHIWWVQDVTRRDDIAKFELIVSKGVAL